ncbi:hypothetical protein [Dyadobacter crusticola]|uniref:hypothetical protein n=1 Tax=Dyadobacter crusticola TaxID=292407 RepID=UPI0004E20268|nr:hypothetical protein [Dyadobacter crusticola]
MDMIHRIYFAILKIAARYGGISTRWSSVNLEDSNYNIHKKAFNFHKNGGREFPIDKDVFFAMQAKGLIIDGSKGGLLIGPSHEEGGILVIRDYGTDQCLVAEIEGWEYLVSSPATKIHRAEIVRINSYFQNQVGYRYRKYDSIPSNVTTLDLRHKLVDGKWERPFLLISGPEQWCVNKHSTRLFLTELNKYNQSI